MTPKRPTRDTVEGRAYLDIQNAARRAGRTTGEYLVLYALEGSWPDLRLLSMQTISSLRAAYCLPRSQRDARPATSTSAQAVSPTTSTTSFCVFGESQPQDAMMAL